VSAVHLLLGVCVCAVGNCRVRTRAPSFRQRIGRTARAPWPRTHSTRPRPIKQCPPCCRPITFAHSNKPMTTTSAYRSHRTRTAAASNHQSAGGFIELVCMNVHQYNKLQQFGGAHGRRLRLGELYGSVPRSCACRATPAQYIIRQKTEKGQVGKFVIVTKHTIRVFTEDLAAVQSGRRPQAERH
jgi:hypothetical protein